MKTPNGETIDLAMDEIVLFINNNTIKYAWPALENGLTKDEAEKALTSRGFSRYMAKAFLIQMTEEHYAYWEDGKLCLPITD